MNGMQTSTRFLFRQKMNGLSLLSEKQSQIAPCAYNHTLRLSFYMFSELKKHSFTPHKRLSFLHPIKLNSSATTRVTVELPGRKKEKLGKVELERTFLVKQLPADLNTYPHKEIID